MIVTGLREQHVLQEKPFKTRIKVEKEDDLAQRSAKRIRRFFSPSV